jgi:UDP-N-acetylglucosamine:LPS N-acetylglucosamine transferase
MKICIAGSAGGHLTELLALVKKLKIEKEKLIFFTFAIPSTKATLRNYRTFYTINPGRNIFKFFKVFFDSLIFLLKYKPRVIITSGAGLVVPLCIIGKFFGVKLVFIETNSRIVEPSLTGRVLYPFADLFFVQWRPLLKKYRKKAKYGGLLI